LGSVETFPNENADVATDTTERVRSYWDSKAEMSEGILLSSGYRGTQSIVKRQGMDRRDFIQDSLLLAGGILLPVRGAWASVEKLNIEYIRPKAPAFQVPAFLGTRYEDKVPDTLDIAERAKLGINCLTEITDPNADHEIYWFADFHRNPPVMVHDFNDWCQNVEGFYESLALLRVASGSELNSNVDKVWMEVLLKSIGPDGLVYVPLNGSPWARLNAAWVTPVWRADGTTSDTKDKSVSQVTNPNLWPRAMALMMVYYLHDSNPMWKQTIEQMIQGMLALATDEGDYAFFPAGGYEPNKKFSGGWAAGEQEMPTGYLALDGGNVRVIQALAQYYRLTGYQPARALAGKLVNYIRFRSDAFDAQGRFRCSAFEKANPESFVEYSKAHGGNPTVEEVKGQTLGGHFHSHTIGILGCIEYATAVNDPELLQWCKSSYEWAKTQGNSTIGFFPEFIAPQYPSCESCEVADMIAIAAKLTQAGLGDYWDDLDRWARNQFAENQLTEEQWIQRQADSHPAKPVAFNETADDIGKKNLGGFAGWSSGNEWALKNGIMHCCTGNSTRAIYYIWENILESRNDELRVNLLLNRASEAADIYSFIPYEGKVSVKMKQPYPNVWIRVPEWVKAGSSEVVGKVNGALRELNWKGRYVNLGAVKQGETIELTFPIATRKVTELIGSRHYTLEIRGNTVISVDPPGKNGALYERAHYKADEAPWRKVQRFVPAVEINW
jgi:Beta-L-arabinofuranosidase, GH127